MPPRYESSHRAGDHNSSLLGLDIHSPVFFTSAGLITLFVALTLIFPQASNALMVAVRNWCLSSFDSFMMLAANVLFLFCALLIVLPVGKIRLGGSDAKPEFSMLSWFAMLFAAGIGIGLMFFGVGEPLSYYGAAEPPLGVAASEPSAVDVAMGATIYHWGLHAWSIYAITGLSLAYFSFNCRLPLTLRSAFYPLLREHSWRWPGHLIDIFAVLATIFGLATSLGLGAAQVNSGLTMLFGIEDSILTKATIIVLITSVALGSVLRGLDGGIKVLSNINMVMALSLLLFVGIAGHVGAFDAIWSTALAYADNIVILSSWSDRPDEGWMQSWTVFYWAWWVSWTPFVGMFIARVSKGRTIREFLAAVLLIPTLVTIIWFAIFGQNALYQVQNEVGGLAQGMESISTGTFQMLSSLPFSQLTTGLGVILVMIFFITSADSGALVIDGITAGGKTDSPSRQRVFWVLMGGALAASMLYVGGSEALAGLQAGTVAAGIPFTLVLLLMMFSLSRGLGLLGPGAKQPSLPAEP
ncbi:MAG: BCCT family transporter [Cellvibrionaceae bacterium]|nr:BCCT family transporter [Cellvibrionaceae bacterium]